MATRPQSSFLDASLQSLAQKQASADIPTLPLRELAAARVAAADEPMPPGPERVAAKVVVRLGREEEAASWIESRGGRLVSMGEKVLVADLPPEALNGIGECPGIRRAEGSRHLLPRLDEARGSATRCDEALLQHNTLTGQGVLVGIVDSGVDWTHQDFRNSDGSTRLEFFGFASRPDGSQVSTFQEFDAAAIDAVLGGGPAIPQGDPQGHGTHCASIAAGNGLALNGQASGQFRGVAPRAGLVAVRSEPLLDDHIIWGIRKTFDMARESGRPAVVTLSLGGHLGPHDGTSAIENVIARESGPGRIIVVAAGNEGGDRIHFQGSLAQGSDLVIPFQITDPNLLFIDVWVPRGDEVDVEIEAPDGTVHSPTGNTVQTASGLFEAHFQEDPVNRDQNLTVFVAQGQPGSIWRIHLRAGTVLHGEVHAWGGTVDPRTSFDIFPDPAANEFSIGMPGTEERCISVGSFVSRASLGGGSNGLVVGQLSPFSSLGPSRYGGLKPDVAAPGQFITAALAAGSQMANAPNLASRRHPSGKYITIQGTSMATPFIAGVIALMLQREPDLTPEEVQQRLRVTCRRDAQTGRVWHPGFGFGKIDVQALLDYEG
jgi:subtilisin family serine protease